MYAPSGIFLVLAIFLVAFILFAQPFIENTTSFVLIHIQNGAFFIFLFLSVGGFMNLNDKSVRYTFCWYCGNEINSRDCETCPRCNWIVCPLCGACSWVDCFGSALRFDCNRFDELRKRRNAFRNVWAELHLPFDYPLAEFAKEHETDCALYMLKHERRLREQEKAKQWQRYLDEQNERDAIAANEQFYNELYSRLEVGAVLVHNSLGKGVVTERHKDKNSKYFSVRFDSGENTFVLNDSFFERFEFE